MSRRLKLLSGIADLHLHSPFFVTLLVAAVSVACWRYSAELPYSTSRIDLIPRDHPARTRFLQLVRDFGPQNTIAVVIEGSSAADRRAFSDRFAKALSSGGGFDGTVFYKIDLERMMASAPFFLDRETLESIKGDLESNQPLVDALPDLAGVVHAVNRRLEESSLKGLAAVSEALPGCRRVQELFRLMNGHARGEKISRRSWMSVLAGRSVAALSLFDSEGYLVSRAEDTHFIFVTPGLQSEELAYLVPQIQRIRAALAAARSHLPGVSASLTGVPIGVLDEYESTQRDLPRSTAASLAGNFLILVLGFRFRPRMALLTMIALAAGIAWTLAFAKATLGYLNLVSSVFVLFLIGMGINYGIYFATRYDLERRRGLDKEAALRLVLQQQGVGILTSALAGSVAFLTLCLCPFRGFQELGLIAGTGLILCLISGTLLLPPLVLLTERFRSDAREEPAGGLFHWFVVLVQAYPVPIALWFSFLTIYSLGIGDLFPFEYDLNRMLPADAECVRAGEKLLKGHALSPMSALVVCRDPREMYARDRALRARPSVETTLSWASFVPDEAERKRAIVRSVADRIGARPNRALPASSADLVRLRRELRTLDDMLASAAHSLDNLAFYVEARAAEQARDEVNAFQDRVRRAKPQEAARMMASLGNALLESWKDLSAEVGRWSKSPAPDDSFVPPELRRSLRSAGGKFAIVVSPREDISQKEAFERFHAAVSEVDPEMTGYPVIIHTMVALLPQVLETTSVKAVLLIALLLSVDLKSPRRIFLAIFPVLIGSAWLMGLMKLAGLKYNPVNFLALPMILGVGVENGVNFVHGFAGRDSARALETQGLGMLLSAGTSIVGFEALAWVSHRGLASFGLLLTLGTTTCLVATIFFLPAIVELEANRRHMVEQWRELLGYRFY
ncbi:MAG: MMPL family transporter [Candidatus Wallbacteria bacterium]|nr:MMPL family transporter [Candidatus Wallbacteria bacterium]